MQLIPIYNIQQNDALPTATFFPLLSKEQCTSILDKFQVKEPLAAKVNKVGGKDSKDENKRKALIHPVPHSEDSRWIYELIADRVGRYNQFGYQFHISGIYSDLQLLQYNEGDHYDWHVDLGPGEAALRKLSVIIQLSDPSTYEGGDVVFNTGTEHVLPRDQGMIAVFPSYVLHKVNPITKGTRYTLVVWCHGHERFK